MTERLLCWKCGADLSRVFLPLGRRDACPSCRAELHVCRLCRWFDPRAPQQCREPTADDVRVKDRANFCGFFVPRLGISALRAADGKQNHRAALDALFGEDPEVR